jgi:ribosome maturation factor RimP
MQKRLKYSSIKDYKLINGNTREGKLLDADESGITIQEIFKEKGKKAVTIKSFIQITDISEIIVLVSFK